MLNLHGVSGDDHDAIRHPPWYLLSNKMKNKKYHAVRAIQNQIYKIV